MEFRRTTLPNGLEVIAEITPDAHSSAAGFFVRTGARDEDPQVMGVSHFLEHMMFKGTASRSAADVDRDFDDIGAEHNAFTSGEMTAFWAHSLPEQLPRALEILADILRPALRPADFEDEKKVILEEIAMYEDQPFWVLYEHVLEAHYGDHPLSHRVLGRTETIEALRRDQMLRYSQARYSADNTTVALAGPIDFEAAAARIADLCGAWERTDARRRYPEARPADARFEMESAKVARHYAIAVSPAPPIQDERRYAAAALAQILGDDEGSRLYWSLVEPGLAEEARAQYDGHDRAGAYVLWFVCSPEQAARVEGTMAEQIDGLVASLDDDDLVRVRSKIATAATLQGELPAGRMHRLGRLWTYVSEYRSLEEELRRINAVTLDDVRAVYEAFPFRPRVTGHMRPPAGPRGAG